MSMQSYPFTSLVTYEDDGKPIYDRAVSAEFMRKFYKKDRCNGVIALNDSNVFRVTSVTPVAMKVRVLGGYCFINGAYGFDENSTDITISPASNQDRIDTIVLRLNEEFEDTGDEIGRSINIRVIEGTPSANPTAPALIRQGDLYDLGIANVYVKAGATSISQQDITDTRNNAERCGYSIPMQELDTTHITDQLQAQVDANVEIIQRAIDDTEASYLEGKISDIEDDVEDLQTDVDSLKNKKHIVSVTGTWTIGQLLGVSQDTLYYVEQPIYFSGVKSTPNFEFTGYSIQGFVLVEKQTGYLYDFMKGYVYKGYDATSNKFQRVDLLDEDMYRTLKAKVEELKVQKPSLNSSTRVTSAGGILIDKITGATQKTDIVKSVGDMGYFDGEWLQGYYGGNDGKYATNNRYVCNANKIPCKSGDSIVISTSISMSFIFALFYKKDGTFISSTRADNTTSLNCTTPNETSYVNINLGVGTDTTITPTTAPRTTLTINGQYAIVVDEWNKNLFDEEIRNGYYENGAFISYSNYVANKNIIKVEPNTNYYFVSSSNGMASFYDSNMNFIGSGEGVAITKNTSFTTPNNATYLNFRLGGDYGDKYKNDIAIIEGTSGSYVRHQSNRVYIPTSQPLHTDDYISKVDGKYKEYHKYGQVDLGSLTFSDYDSTNKRYSASVSSMKYDDTKKGTNIFVDGFNVSTSEENNTAFSYASNIYLYTDISNKSTFMNYVKGKILVYELATPTTTECIDQSAFYQLESYAEQTTVDMADNIGSMDISYGVTDTVSKAINGERLGYLANLDSGSSSGGEVGFIHTSSTEVAFERESVTGDVTFTTVKDGWYSLLIETVQAVGGRTIAIAINDINVCSLRLVGNTYDRTQITLPIKAGTTIEYKCTVYVVCNCRATIIC